MNAFITLADPPSSTAPISGGKSTASVSASCLTQRPRSAIAQVKSFFTRMFFDLRSRCAIPGLPDVKKICYVGFLLKPAKAKSLHVTHYLPCVPMISMWRWASPVAIPRAMRAIWDSSTAFWMSSIGWVKNSGKLTLSQATFPTGLGKILLKCI